MCKKIKENSYFEFEPKKIIINYAKCWAWEKDIEKMGAHWVG